MRTGGQRVWEREAELHRQSCGRQERSQVQLGNELSRCPRQGNFQASEFRGNRCCLSPLRGEWVTRPFRWCRYAQRPATMVASLRLEGECTVARRSTATYGGETDGGHRSPLQGRQAELISRQARDDGSFFWGWDGSLRSDGSAGASPSGKAEISDGHRPPVRAAPPLGRDSSHRGGYH